MKNLIIITIAVLVPILTWSLSQPAAAQEEPPATTPNEATVPNEATAQTPKAAGPTDIPAAPSDPNNVTAPETTIVAEVTLVPNDGDGILLNFKNAPLGTILEHLSEVVGLVIVSDTDIDGRLTIISRQPMTIEEVVSLINSALIKENYAAIKMGRTLKIVPLDEAKKMNIPVQSGNDPEKVTPGDDMVTHVIAVRFASAVKLKEELADLVPSYADLAANAETNALIITDTTANVRRFIEIVRALDTQMSAIAEVKVFRLKYSDATNTARLINEVFQPDTQQSSRRNQQGTSPIERMMSFRDRGGGGSRGRGGDESQDEASPATRIVASADEYTNTLVVAGPAETLGLIETVVKELDSNPQEEQSVMVYPLQNAQAENLKDVMNNLFQQMAQLLYNQGGGLGRGGGGSSRFGGRSQMGSSGRSSGSSALSGAGNLAGQVYFESDEDTNSLLIITASKNFDKVKKIIAELDKPVPQVLIKVLIAEVTHDESLDLGTEFSMINIAHTGNSITTSTDFNIAAQTSGLVVAGIQGDLDVTLRALETQGKLNILSRPYILTSNNQPATITIGERVPFIRDSTFSETGQTRNSIVYEDIGIILEVTPSINPEGLVIMDVKPEISAITGITVPISETIDAPVFAKRSAESRVAIRDGQTIVIGGLVQDKETETIKKVPLLGDIPLLGLLFQRRETEKQKTELLIFLTPHVAMKDMELNKITDQEKAKSNLFKDPSQSPLFEEHIKAMMQEDLSQPNENNQ